MFAELVFFLCAFMALIIFVQSNRRNRKMGNLKALPGPVQLPIIGSAIQLGMTVSGYQLHYQRLHAICEKYGKIVGMKVGVQYYVCTEDFDTAKEVMNSPAWIPRFPAVDLYKEHTYGKNLGLMWSSGDSWKEMRRFTTRTLKNFGFGELKSADAFLEEELECFVQSLDADRRKSNDEILMRHYFKIPTFNILWRVMSGHRFLYDDQDMKQLVHFVEDVAEIQIGADMEWSFPYLRSIPGVSKSKQKKGSFDGCHEFFENIMRKRREVGTFREIQNDFIDYFLLKVDEEKDNASSLYTDEQFVATCADLLFGGVDTTANSLEFAVLYMVKYPEVQDKVRQEINAIVGKNRSPSSSDRARMPYTEATMLEVLRHANIVPVNGRTSLHDTTLNGCFVPKNAIAGINLTIIHMSKEIWGEDSHVFRPERFLDSNMKIVNDDKLFAFGGGKRVCIGQSMAKVIWLAFFTQLIQRYTFKRSPAHPDLCTIPKAGIANTAKPFYCIVTETDGN